MSVDRTVKLMHHTLEVVPWKQLPGGVRVGNWADVDPDTGEPAPMLLLRDATEVLSLMEALDAALQEADVRHSELCGVKLGDTGNHCEFVKGHAGKHGVWVAE